MEEIMEDFEEAMIEVMSYENFFYISEGEVFYKGALTFETGKDEYLVATIYTKDYEELIFTMLESTE